MAAIAAYQAPVKSKPAYGGQYAKRGARTLVRAACAVPVGAFAAMLTKSAGSDIMPTWAYKKAKLYTKE